MEQTSPQVGTSRLEFWGMAALVGILVVCVVVSVTIIVANMTVKEAPPLPIDRYGFELPPDEIQKLQKLTGDEALKAMRALLESSNDIDVKIYCIQGLGKIYKDFDSIPLLLKIMDKNDVGTDEDLALRHQAYLAVVAMPGMVDRFYDARAPLADRQEIVRGYRMDWNIMPPRRGK